MLAYSAGRRRIAARRSSPSTMLLIIGGHVAAVAIVMSVKMAVERAPADPPIIIDTIAVPKDPPPPPQADPRRSTQTPQSTPYQPPVAVPLPPLAGDPLETSPVPQPIPGPIVGKDPPAPTPLPLPLPDPVKTGPRLATPASALRPPYPSSKLDSQEEAALKLRLSIDERGRVVAVDPVGPADAAFLASARRHLIARWRYQPATVDGRPIASSTVITLRFQLEG